jgi:hypothetical protein
MPLIKSGSAEAVGKNIKTEMTAGKPSSLRKLQQDRMNRRQMIADKVKDM